MLLQAWEYIFALGRVRGYACEGLYVKTSKLIEAGQPLPNHVTCMRSYVLLFKQYEAAKILLLSIKLESSSITIAIARLTRLSSSTISTSRIG